MAALDQPARVMVDCRRPLGPLPRLWTSFGYDELNWTATPRGKENLAALHAIGDIPYTVRAHNIFTSGSGRGLPHWSSGNVYHVAATVEHFKERYGARVVRTWYWELWNEPDISYWQGSIDEYCRLYDVTVAAVTSVLPEAAVGGPATTGRGSAFLGQFLAHCADGPNAVTGGRGGVSTLEE
ncbi:MAG TPA: hypothetical protein VNL35_05425 [Chloroflexota bacterium]|nr:hypothetical protein [Chloroflexota bacterium]